MQDKGFFARGGRATLKKWIIIGIIAILAIGGIVTAVILSQHSTIRFSAEELGFSGRAFIKHGESYQLEVREYPYHTFEGYADEDGTFVTDAKGASFKPLEKDSKLELHAVYTPYKYNFSYNLSEADNNDSFRYYESSFQISYGDYMPQLLDATKTKHDLVGYKIKTSKGEAVISEGRTFLDGKSLLTEAGWELPEQNETIYIIPIFDKHKLSMSFVYTDINGKEITETMKVYIETPVYEVGPTYTDADGFTHGYAWRDENGEYYTGETAEGLTVYGNEFCHTYRDAATDTVTYEVYELDTGISYLKLNPAVTSGIGNADFCVDIYPYINELVIDPLTEVSEYVGLRFNVLERDEDLTFGFDLTKGGDISLYSFKLGEQKEPISFIDATKMSDGAELILKIDNCVSIYGSNGTNGISNSSLSGETKTGEQRSDYTLPHSAGAGGDGADAVTANTLKLIISENAVLNIYGGNGGNGGNGGKPWTTNLDGHFYGIKGDDGGKGGNGGAAITAKSVTLDSLGSLGIYGGNGGNGGNGGEGSDGIGIAYEPDSGGDGGDGGFGGNGGPAVSFKEEFAFGSCIDIKLIGGNGGNGGNGGKGGSAEGALWGWHDPGVSGDGGDSGLGGAVGLATSQTADIPEGVTEKFGSSGTRGEPGEAGDAKSGAYKGDPGSTYPYGG